MPKKPSGAQEVDSVHWRTFKGGIWKEEPNVSDFIRANITPYHGDSSFLIGPTDRTKMLWKRCLELQKAERQSNGVLGIDVTKDSDIGIYNPGFIDRENEVILGLQTAEPLVRPVHCKGGLRMAQQACQAYGYLLDDSVSSKYGPQCRTHNDAVFATYTPEMKKARKLGLLTGLPDSYGRGRLIGDYRRVALYGTKALIAWKKDDITRLNFDAEDLLLREELTHQIDSMTKLEKLGSSYGFDLTRPASTACEAFQWVYLAYLAALQSQNGAAMSLGRVSSFLDIYIERDLAEGLLTESQCQELVDGFVIKLRMARMLRTPEYNTLFAGDPLWITEAIGGMGTDGRTYVTKTSYRFLHTLENLGPAPEPNLTVLWSEQLPHNFKQYCASLSLSTSAIQYENDDLMRHLFDDDYGIACCVSATKLGKDSQYFGARCNLPKLLLLAINGGLDELQDVPIGPQNEPLTGRLDYNTVWSRLMKVLDWFVPFYAETMNLIHFMHDKYCYEAFQMSLIDSKPSRYMTFGIAGLSIVIDSLSAIRHATVIAKQKEFQVAGDFPKYGNDDDAADEIGKALIEEFHRRLKECSIYRGALPTLSILTITSNVVYGSKTGGTPDGRKVGTPFAPGANPLHGRETSGLLASMNSVAKLPYDCCTDGISYTVSLQPEGLGRDIANRANVLVGLIDGFFEQKAHHINVNTVSRDVLIQAMSQPELFSNLTLRVSGYAVHFIKLNREQQREVLMRTYHSSSDIIGVA